MALWASLWRYGFILGLWLCLAIISIPWGYIVSEPLLALCTGVEDLIYLSQGLRDHPTRLLYRIMPGSPVLFLKGWRKRWCNMQLHTCQTEPGLVIHEEWSTEGNAFKCILCHGLLAQKKKTEPWNFCLWQRGYDPQHLVLEHEETDWDTILRIFCMAGGEKKKALCFWWNFFSLQCQWSAVEAFFWDSSLPQQPFLKCWNCIIQTKNVELALSVVLQLEKK